MNFEYHSFEVETYLKAGIQPIFTLKAMSPQVIYYTMTDPATGAFAKTTNHSDAVRIPVFGLVTHTLDGTGESLKNMTHGSLLACTGIEIATRFIGGLGLTKPIARSSCRYGY